MLTQAVRLMLVATTVVAAPLSAPPGVGRITGHVRDAAGSPLAGAQVVVVGTKFVAATDRTGGYAIESVLEGAYSVQARFIGYPSLEVHGVRVAAVTTTTTDFALQPAIVTLNAVVATGVTAARAKMADAAAVGGVRQLQEQ